MKEAIFILLVVFALFALTAFRYRKQIAGMIGFARMLKDAKENLTKGSNQIKSGEKTSIPLVNCSKCGIWVPQNKSRRVGDLFFCSDECVEQQKSGKGVM